MTVINFDLRAVAATGRVPIDARIRWQPVGRRVDGSVVILPETHSVKLALGLGSADLDPGYYWFTEATTAGSSAVRLVPESGPVDYADLVAVDPATLDPSAVPDPAWLAMAGSTVTGGEISGDDLILERTDGSTVNAGNVRGPEGPVSDTSLAAALGLPAGQSAAAVKAIMIARSMLNILDYGVSRGTAATQTAAIKAALDANPGRAFYFPPGDYRLDTGLVIAQANSLILDPDARLYAGAAMDTLVAYLWGGAGYAEDKAITGGLLDGNLLASKILTLGKIIRFSLTRATFRNGINRGLVTTAGLGAELFAYDLRFYNTGVTNVADNIAIEANMGDSHFRDIVIRDWTVAVKDTAANRWDRIHPWIGPDAGANTHMTSRYPSSIAFDMTGASDMQGCLADTFRTAFKSRTNGTGFTAPPRLRNCRAAWVDNPTLPTAFANANQAYVVDNTDGIGVDCADMSLKGHSTAAPAVRFLTGPSTNLNVRNTHSHGFVTGDQGTTSDSFDYRRGVQQGSFTFTPTVYGSTGAGAHALTTQTGRMVVTADEVTYHIRVVGTLDATTGFAGSLRLGGLPLPPGATGVRDGSGHVAYSINVNTSSACIFANTAPFVSIMTMGATSGSEVQVSTQSLRGKTIDLMLAVTATYYKS